MHASRQSKKCLRTSFLCVFVFENFINLSINIRSTRLVVRRLRVREEKKKARAGKTLEQCDMWWCCCVFGEVEKYFSAQLYSSQLFRWMFYFTRPTFKKFTITGLRCFSSTFAFVINFFSPQPSERASSFFAAAACLEKCFRRANERECGADNYSRLICRYPLEFVVNLRTD